MESAERRNPPVEPGDEADLIRAAQSGDSAAFTEIVRRYQRAVYRVVYGLTRNASDADDLAQETFVRAYKAIGRFRVGEPFYPWVSRIAVNAAYSLFRSRKRKPETSIEPMLEAGHQWEAGEDPVEEVARSERVEHMNAAFAELSEEHQAVLVLRVVEGLSYDEIAETLHVPPGTVMSRLSRARTELKKRMQARTGETT